MKAFKEECQNIADGITAIINGGKAVLCFVGGLFKQGSNTSNDSDGGEQSDGIQQVNGNPNRINNAPTNEATNSSGEIMDEPFLTFGGGIRGKVAQNLGQPMNAIDKIARSAEKIAQIATESSGESPPMSISDTVRIADDNVSPNNLDTLPISSNGKVFIVEKKKSNE